MSGQASAEHYGHIGALLKAAREEMRLPLEQAAREIHIRPRYLDALESGRLDDLPGLAYTRGYLRRYAAFLALDTEEVLRRFDRVEALESRGFYLPEALGKDKAPAAWAVWGGLAAALAVCALWALLHAGGREASPVEPFAPPPEPPPQAACLREQAVYYPPCLFVPYPNIDFIRE